MMRRLKTVTLAAGVFACVLCADDAGPSAAGWFAKADAVIGRPLTPMSYAGVARRTTRRAAYGAGAYGYPPPYYPPACQPVYDAYGRLVRAC
jgi:hypothetical protein